MSSREQILLYLPDPDITNSGSVLTIEAAGNFTEKIEKGSYVDLTVKYGLIRLISNKEDLCDQLKNVDKECPIDKGRTVVKKEVEIPKQVPLVSIGIDLSSASWRLNGRTIQGHYTVKADVFTPNGTRITCLTASITF